MCNREKWRNFVYYRKKYEKSTKYFEQFYQVISDEIMVSRIRSCHTPDEIYGILCNYTKTVK